MSPYGSYDTVIETLRAQVAPGPWLLGERFTAADVLWGGGLGWTMMFGVVPKLAEFVAYSQRVTGRPAAVRVRKRDAALAAAQDAARAAKG